MNHANRDKSKDRCEEGLPVPNFILNNCQDLFIAAGEKYEKVST